jgi:hypothetical protein
MMKFQVLCMTDGAVEVTLDDLTAVVFDGQEDVQLVFACPVCGDEVRVGVHIPNLQVASNAREAGGDAETFQVFAIDRDEPGEPVTMRAIPDDDPLVERYCEYFRRQLASVDSVDAFLAEVENDR